MNGRLSVAPNFINFDLKNLSLQRLFFGGNYQFNNFLFFGTLSPCIQTTTQVQLGAYTTILDGNPVAYLLLVLVKKIGSLVHTPAQLLRRHLYHKWFFEMESLIKLSTQDLWLYTSKFLT